MGISRRPAKYSGKKDKARDKAAAKAQKRAAKAAKKKPAKSKKVEEKRDGFVLTVVDGQQSGKEHFYDRSASIGRVDENDIVVIDPGMSRNHARVMVEHGVYLLQDLQSANGTRLNGDQIGTEPEVLRDGDYITFGTTTMQFSVIESLRGEVTAETRLDDISAARVDKTGPHEPGKRGFFRRPLGKLVIVLLLAGVGGGVAYKMLHKKASLGSSDNSDVPLTYSEDDKFFNAVFGLCKYDRTHPSHVIINFEYLGGRAELQYGAWGVDKVGEVEVRLNGHRIGQVELTMFRWRYGLKIPLPRDKLRKDKTNRLVFDSKLNPPAGDSWGVCYVQILQEAIPPPDPKEARHRFQLAKKAFEDREVEPGNMYNALVGLKKARNYLEGLPTKGEFYNEVVDYLNRVDKALTKRFQEGLFSARRAEKVRGDKKAARLLLLRAMRYFHKDDFRYREFKRYLDRLSGAR